MNVFYIPAISAVLLSAVSQTLLKISAGKTWPSPLRQYLNVYVISGYFLLGCSLLLALFSYKYLGYMESVILEPIAYILVLLIGCFIFREKITVRKALGMCLIVAGILVFNLF